VASKHLQPKEADVGRSDHQPCRDSRAHDRDRLVACDEQLHRAGELPELIQSVFDKLVALASDEPAPSELTPAVPVKKSVTDDYIVCLEDGEKLKMLKRHLMTAYGMTPEEYRARWGLKADYPMVAPNYAKKRQELAKKIGLGRKPRLVEPEPAPAPKARRSWAKAAA
jgi:predicted transcriptional regulator